MDQLKITLAVVVGLTIIATWRWSLAAFTAATVVLWGDLLWTYKHQPPKA